MSLTPEQQTSAAAWAHVCADSSATRQVLDDLTAFCSGLSESQQPGAMRLLLYILSKRTQLRRSERAPKGKSKT